MTESEAKTKVCPMQIDGWNDRKYNCIGSECMAWRDQRKLVPHPDGPPYAPEEEVIGGYCGLAGKP